LWWNESDWNPATHQVQHHYLFLILNRHTGLQVLPFARSNLKRCAQAIQRLIG
jgi:hypothetical protein